MEGGAAPTRPTGYSGWLLKRGRLNTAWKRRYFVLSGGLLRYYADSTCAASKGELQVQRCSVDLQGPVVSGAGEEGLLRRLLSTTARNESFEGGYSKLEVDKAGTPREVVGYIFTIRVSGRSLELQAASEVEACEWKEVLERGRAGPLGEASERGTGGAPAGDWDPTRDPSPPSHFDYSHFERLQPWEAPLTTTAECTAFLESFPGTAAALAQGRRLCAHFLRVYNMGGAGIDDEVRLEAWKGTARRLTKATLDELLKVPGELETASFCGERLLQMQVAVESFMLAQIHGKLMAGLCELTAPKDAAMTSLQHRLARVDQARVRDIFGIQEAHERALEGGAAVAALRGVDGAGSAVEKAVLLKGAVMAMMQRISRANHEAAEAAGDPAPAGSLQFVPCTDDLICLVLLLLLRTPVPHIFAQLAFVDHFLHLNNPDSSKGELGYHLTNFMVGCEYLVSEPVQLQIRDLPPGPLDSAPCSPPPAQGASAVQECEDDFIHTPLGRVRRGTSLSTEASPVPAGPLAEVPRGEAGAGAGAGEAGGEGAARAREQEEEQVTRARSSTHHMVEGLEGGLLEAEDWALHGGLEEEAGEGPAPLPPADRQALEAMLASSRASSYLSYEDTTRTDDHDDDDGRARHLTRRASMPEALTPDAQPALMQDSPHRGIRRNTLPSPSTDKASHPSCSASSLFPSLAALSVNEQDMSSAAPLFSLDGNEVQWPPPLSIPVLHRKSSSLSGASLKLHLDMLALEGSPQDTTEPSSPATSLPEPPAPLPPPALLPELSPEPLPQPPSAHVDGPDIDWLPPASVRQPSSLAPASSQETTFLSPPMPSSRAPSAGESSSKPRSKSEGVSDSRVSEVDRMCRRLTLDDNLLKTLRSSLETSGSAGGATHMGARQHPTAIWQLDGSKAIGGASGNALEKHEPAEAGSTGTIEDDFRDLNPLAGAAGAQGARENFLRTTSRA